MMANNYAVPVYQALKNNENVAQNLDDFVCRTEIFNENNRAYDFIKEYIHLSGDCQEIINLIKTLKDSEPQYAVSVLQTLRFILSRLASDLNNYSIVENAIVNEVLAHGFGTIITFLAPQQKHERSKVALQLLSAMVALGGHAASQVVTKLDFNSSAFQHLLQKSNARSLLHENENLRTTFLNLIVIILAVSTNSIVGRIVEIKDFISNILVGLAYDTPATVILVLTTLRERVVENSSISKVIKMKAFNHLTLKPLLQFYTWKGPLKRVNYKRKLGDDGKQILYNASKTDVSDVRDTVHKFLKSLLCSNETGVVTHDSSVGTSGKNNNKIVTSILQRIIEDESLTFCTDPLVSDLLISILTVCPDQLKYHQASLLERFDPRPTPSWLAASEFYTKLIGSFDVAKLVLYSDKKDCLTLLYLAKSLCFFKLLNPNKIQPIFKMESILCYHLCKVLQSILKSVKNLVEVSSPANVENVAYTASEMAAFQRLFVADFCQVFAFKEELLNYWSKIVHESMDVTDNIALKDCPLPTFLEEFTVFLSIFKTLFNLSEKTTFHLDIDIHLIFKGLKGTQVRLQKEEIVYLYLDIMELFSAQDTLDLWNEKNTDSPIALILDVYETAHTTGKLSSATAMLNKLLLSTKIFDQCEWEVNAWVEAVNASETKHVPLIFQLITTTICSLLKNQISDTKSSKEITRDKSGAEMNGFTKSLESRKLLKQINAGFSPFVSEVLRSVSLNAAFQGKDCQSFVEKALIAILNHQNSPREFFSTIAPFKSFLSIETVIFFELLSSNSTDQLNDVILPGLQKDKLQFLLSGQLHDIDQGLDIVTKFLNFILENRKFELLSPDGFSELVSQFTTSSKTQKKILRQHLSRLLEECPSFGSFISNETVCQKVLSSTSSKDRPFISQLLTTSATFRKSAQSFSISCQDDPSQFLFFASKLLMNCEDEEYRAAITPVYWTAMCGWLLEDSEDRMENDVGKAGALLLEKGHVALKKLSELCKSVAKKDNRPSLHKQEVFISLFRCARNEPSEKKRCSNRILRITLTWLKADLINKSYYQELASFINSFLCGFDSVNLEEFIDIESFFTMTLKAALRDECGKELLSLITSLCCKSSQSSIPVKSVHGLVISHSNFFKIMLKEAANTEPLVDLLLALTQKDPKVCNENHVSLFLSAYGGTMSVLDQKILCLIKLYADNNVNMTKYRPFLWGKLALEHYSFINRNILTLWKQPKQQDVLSLFLPEMIESTVLNIPLDLGLAPSVITSIEESLAHKIYDFRFFLPLLASLLDAGSYVQCKNFIESRTLKLIFVCLSSTQSDTRSLAYHCLAQFYYHLEAAPSNERYMWLCLLDSLRNSIEAENQRIAYILALFMGRVAQIFSEPEHKLYQLLVQFIMAKPCLNISQVPEFYKLFNSTGIEHRSDRMWMLNLLADGMRTSSDFHVCEMRYVPRTLMVHYASSISTREERTAILRVFCAAVKIEPAARKLISDGLLPWLLGVIEQSNSVDTLTQRAVKKIIETLQNTQDISSAELSLFQANTSTQGTVRQEINDFLRKTQDVSIAELDLFEVNNSTQDNVAQIIEASKKKSKLNRESQDISLTEMNLFQFVAHLKKMSL